MANQERSGTEARVDALQQQQENLMANLAAPLASGATRQQNMEKIEELQGAIDSFQEEEERDVAMESQSHLNGEGTKQGQGKLQKPRDGSLLADLDKRGQTPEYVKAERNQKVEGEKISGPKYEGPKPGGRKL